MCAFRVCGRRTKEAAEKKPVKCNQELRMTGGESCEVGHRIQTGIKRGMSTNVKIFVQGNEQEMRVMLKLWLAYN